VNIILRLLLLKWWVSIMLFVTINYFMSFSLSLISLSCRLSLYWMSFYWVLWHRGKTIAASLWSIILENLNYEKIVILALAKYNYNSFKFRLKCNLQLNATVGKNFQGNFCKNNAIANLPFYWSPKHIWLILRQSRRSQVTIS